MKILVVDDEQDICEILQYNLETEGYEVDTAYSAEEALAYIEKTMQTEGEKLPDLMLLDVMMGEMSGFQLTRHLKRNPATAHISIIFVTALEGEDNTVKGLNIGADDYIAKPLSMNEVKARVKAVLRRGTQVRQTTQEPEETRPMDQSHIICYEGLILNESTKTVTLDGTLLPLTRLEYELLKLFLKHPNQVFGRDSLLARCWPSETYVLDRTVDVTITRLRKKISQYGKQIKTRVGYGYYFER